MAQTGSYAIVRGSQSPGRQPRKSGTNLSFNYEVVCLASRSEGFTHTQRIGESVLDGSRTFCSSSCPGLQNTAGVWNG